MAENKGLIDINAICSQKDFAKLIGVSEKSVSDMRSRGVIEVGQYLGEWIKLYCLHLREQAAGRQATGDIDLTTERAKLSRAQYERIEMQNAVTRKEFGPIDAVEFCVTDLMVRVAAQLDTIPGKIKIASDKLTASDIDVVVGVIATVRNDIASMEINWFGDNSEENELDT